MRIAMISTPHLPTPPRGYGASELIAGLLAEGLRRRGHHVRLFACPDSEAAVDESRHYPEIRLAQTFDQRELIHVARAVRDADDCDVIHNHCLAAGSAFAALSRRPFLSTLHYVHPLVTAFPSAPYVAVSEQQRSALSGLNVIGRVYNGIDVRAFPMGRRRDDYLMFLGRFHPNKGADLAIETARRSGRRLIIAAPSPPDDQRDWFEREIRPKLGGPIEWIGPVDRELKASLLARATATLVPLRWDEPFGLVMVESMACGTPPIAMRRGAAPEIIVDGVTGYLVDSPQDMVPVVDRASEIDPLACRRHVEACFSVDRMVDQYVALYQDYLMRS